MSAARGIDTAWGCENCGFTSNFGVEQSKLNTTHSVVLHLDNVLRIWSLVSPLICLKLCANHPVWAIWDTWAILGVHQSGNHQAVKCFLLSAGMAPALKYMSWLMTTEKLITTCYPGVINFPPSFFNFSTRSWGSEYWNWGHRGYPLVLENLRYVPPTFWPSNRCQIPNAKHLCSDLVVEVTVWLVVDLPLWKIWVRQLGWWHSQLNEKIKVMFVPNHQPAI